MTNRASKFATQRGERIEPDDEIQTKLDALLAKATPEEKAWFKQLKEGQDARAAKIEADGVAFLEELKALPPDVAIAAINGGSYHQQKALIAYMRKMYEEDRSPARALWRVFADAFEDGHTRIEEKVAGGGKRAKDPYEEGPFLVFVSEGWKIKWARTKRIRGPYNAMYSRKDKKQAQTDHRVAERITGRGKVVEGHLQAFIKKTGRKQGATPWAIKMAAKELKRKPETIKADWKAYQRMRRTR